MPRLLLILLFVVGCTCQGVAQRSFGVAYYDVDALYDTLPSPQREDVRYTPRGELRWSGEKYLRKVKGIARVIDSMALPVVGLYGVENEDVVRDIAARSQGDYAYIYRSQDSFDGLDFAMLYMADMFFVERVTAWRGVMCVEAEVYGRPLTIVLAHRCFSIGVLFKQLAERGADENIIVMGEPSERAFEGLGLRDVSQAIADAARGNIFVDGRWELRDRVASNMQGVTHCEVYVKRWLLNSQGEPNATYLRRIYYGGNGRRLPIFIYFNEIFGY